MAKITLDPVTGGYDLSVINNNFDKLETELNSKVMYRNNPVGEPNTWESDLDANNKRLYNLPAPTIASEAARLTDIQGLMNGLGSLVQFTPYKNISSINLQSAIQEEIDDLESTAGAGLIGILDIGAKFTGSTVETALSETRTAAELAASSGSSLVGFLQSGVGAVLRTSQSKFRDVISIKDFGAVGDGITNDTAAVQAAITEAAVRGVVVFAPAGNYKIGQLTFPSTSKGITGEGVEATKFTISGSFTAFTPILFFDQLNGFYVGNFSIDANTTTYATNHATQFGACQKGVVEKIKFIAGGYIALYAPGCSNVTFRDHIIEAVAVSLFVADTTPSRLTLDNIIGLAFGTGVGIAIAGGSYHKIVNCYAPGAGTTFFSISLFQCNDSIVSNNYAIGITLEAIQVTDGNRNRVEGNTVFCLNGHNDFGISIFSDGTDISHNKVSGNTIVGSGGSGIGVSASFTPVVRTCQLNSITDNLIINPNQRNDVEGSGILLLGGATCTGNVIANNTCVDESNKMRYGANEWNSGGNPDNNRLINNPCFGGAVFISEGNIVGTNSEVYDLATRSYTPTITATSGTITSSTGTAFYKRRGKMVEFSANITITNNGTGAGAVVMSTPFTAVDGCLNGRANAVSGKQIHAANGGSGNFLIRNYDGTYPGATNENFLISGIVKI